MRPAAPGLHARARENANHVEPGDRTFRRLDHELAIMDGRAHSRPGGFGCRFKQERGPERLTVERNRSPNSLSIEARLRRATA